LNFSLDKGTKIFYISEANLSKEVKGKKKQYYVIWTGAMKGSPWKADAAPATVIGDESHNHQKGGKATAPSRSGKAWEEDDPRARIPSCLWSKPIFGWKM